MSEFLEVEPSDAERATWPDQTAAYVASLEAVLAPPPPWVQTHEQRVADLLASCNEWRDRALDREEAIDRLEAIIKRVVNMKMRG